jgi:hypothetical protein
MPETENLPPELKEQVEKVDSADVVIGLPAYKTNEDLNWAADFGGTELKILIAYPEGTEAVAPEQFPGVRLVHYPVPAPDRLLTSLASIYGSFHPVFQISQRVGARVCCVWNSGPQFVSKDIIDGMLAPVLYQNFDLAMPSYVELKLGTLINSGILYPVTRSLYGKRIHFPMAIDLALSGQFVDLLLQPDPSTRQPRSLQWIASQAIRGGQQVCQVNLPIEPPLPPDAGDLSSILATVLGRLYLDMERNSAFWQRSNGSQNVPAFGEPYRKDEETGALDVQRMIEAFQLAYRNLSEIWSVALPPATLLELKKLTKAVQSEFRMPDDLWVRIVYDFALGHRQRSINRDHLLRAMTPLYLAWVASYALEVMTLSGAGFQGRLERLALAYERQKPYLLSRWRWPDRFNP